jgi:hypothetical protein
VHKHVKDFIIGRASMTYDARALARFSQCLGDRDSFRWSRIDRSAIASLEMFRLLRENAATLVCIDPTIKYVTHWPKFP